MGGLVVGGGVVVGGLVVGGGVVVGGLVVGGGVVVGGLVVGEDAGGEPLPCPLDEGDVPPLVPFEPDVVEVVEDELPPPAAAALARKSVRPLAPIVDHVPPKTCIP